MSEQLEELKSEVARLQRRIGELETAEEQPVGRRNMLRALGAAGAGAAVGSLALARPASAADGGLIVIGAQNTSDTPTILTTNPGYAANPEQVGAFHVTNDVTQSNPNLIASCISAIATGAGSGGGQTIAFAGAGSQIGAKLDGPTPLKLSDSTSAGAPTADAGTVGQFRVDGGNLWYCVKSKPILGSGDAVWRLIASEDDPPTPVATLQFVPVTPYRAYDSRFVDGPLAVDTNRTNSVADAIDIETGATTTTDAIPAGAQAIAYNLTAVSPTNRGNLAVTPQSATEQTAASLNYQSTTTAIGNASITGVSGDRQVKVFCSGSPGHTVEYVLDVSAYWI